MPSLALAINDLKNEAAAQALAQRLNLPLISKKEGFDYILSFQDNQLILEKPGAKSLPLTIDFLSGKMSYRIQHISLRKETLARALGLKKNSKPTIVDATAGLGRDSFIIAALGFEVILLERSPIVHALLEDGMKRAAACPNTQATLARMHLIQTDAQNWLANLNPSVYPQVVYLDPMFPERHKSALVKKEMRIFHDILGEDKDADQLLHTALACATQRVVVKRPRLSTALANLSPNFSIIGSSSRFDIYLK